MYKSELRALARALAIRLADKSRFGDVLRRQFCVDGEIPNHTASRRAANARSGHRAILVLRSRSNSPITIKDSRQELSSRSNISSMHSTDAGRILIWNRQCAPLG